MLIFVTIIIFLHFEKYGLYSIYLLFKSLYPHGA
jgi:hypothetical protein